MKKGSTVYLKSPFWHKNTDLGGRQALVLSTDSYILVKVYDYDSNPVKCFRNEVSEKPTKLEKPDEDAKPPDHTEFYNEIYGSGIKENKSYKALKDYLDAQDDYDGFDDDEEDSWKVWSS